VTSDLKNTVIPKSDQLNADDFISGPKTIRVTGVKVLSGNDQPVSISYEGDMGKPYKPCKSMRRVLIVFWGTDGEDYVGKYMTLFNDTSVKWAGKAVGGIRISHMSDIKEDSTIILTVSRAVKKAFKVLLMKSKPPVTSSEEATSEEDFIGAWKAWVDSWFDKSPAPTVEQVNAAEKTIDERCAGNQDKPIVLEYFNSKLSRSQD